MRSRDGAEDGRAGRDLNRLAWGLRVQHNSQCTIQRRIKEDSAYHRRQKTEAEAKSEAYCPRLAWAGKYTASVFQTYKQITYPGGAC